MHVWREIESVPKPAAGTIVTIGNFDGVHIGHCHLFRDVRERAAASGALAVATTFDPHPMRVLAPARELKLLTPMPERLALMEAAGLDAALVLHFDQQLAALDPQDFVRTILVNALRARQILVGGNFRFGRNAAGHVDLLWELGARYGFTVAVIDPVQARGGIVSSTRIRNLLMQGQVSAAARLLGRHYEVSGAVVTGRGVGSRETVPTLNMAEYPELLPKRGVYITETECGGYRAQSVTNIGRNPTFQETELHLESHYLNAPPAGWTAASEMRVNFLYRIRDEIKFPSVDALRTRIGRDIALARRYFAHIQSQHGAKT
jgi:riboflavin kinase/FMN adenylyltransferase